MIELIPILTTWVGDVLRVSPNELSFANASAWKSIYGVQKGAPITKSEFWDMIGLGFDAASIGSERDYHAALRKRELFAEAFSDRNLAKQEPIMQIFVNQLIEKIGKLGNTDVGIDMDKWFVYFSFDLTGKMAFGESFACLEKETSHEWLDLILPLFFIVNVADNFRRLPFVVTLASMIPTKWTNGIRSKIVKYSKDQTAKRLQVTSMQNDFFDNVSDKVRKGEVSEEEMAAHLFTLSSVAAGETSATAMSGMLYYLLSTPIAHEKLKREVRGAYENAQDIDIASTLRLPYLQAVFKEAMRIFPVVPQGLPRLSPGAVIEGTYVPQGVR
ncbi:hypothetical protein N0V90_007139 [Kalmusia sp. IMI 367209]|nr:hypothetical protein N0V90_007139 [Kalmusia sp. IMI 367209]